MQITNPSWHYVNFCFSQKRSIHAPWDDRVRSSLTLGVLQQMQIIGQLSET